MQLLVHDGFRQAGKCRIVIVHTILADLLDDDRQHRIALFQMKNRFPHILLTSAFMASLALPAHDRNFLPRRSQSRSRAPSVRPTSSDSRTYADAPRKFACRPATTIRTPRFALRRTSDCHSYRSNAG